MLNGGINKVDSMTDKVLNTTGTPEILLDGTRIWGEISLFKGVHVNILDRFNHYRLLNDKQDRQMHI